MAEGGISSRDEELLTVLRKELRAEYEERILTDARRACLRIDELVSSALRQLPPEVRNMPAREALNLLPGDARLGGLGGTAAVAGGGSSGSGGGREDAQTQTSQTSLAVSPQKRSRKGSSDELDTDARQLAWMASSMDSSEVGKYPQGKLEEVLRQKKELDEFHSILMHDACERLEDMDPQQRENFLSRANDAVEAFSRILPGGVGGSASVGNPIQGLSPANAGA
mmetsp:Transcript_3179/g.7614  ORF Transcript_3179/g.7614 Transcript_3179/m.7614 type:complete len:225 (-) Transcript_3179:205-879(-)